MHSSSKLKEKMLLSLSLQEVRSTSPCHLEVVVVPDQLPLLLAVPVQPKKKRSQRRMSLKPLTWEASSAMTTMDTETRYGGSPILSESPVFWKTCMACTILKEKGACRSAVA